MAKFQRTKRSCNSKISKTKTSSKINLKVIKTSIFAIYNIDSKKQNVKLEQALRSKNNGFICGSKNRLRLPESHSKTRLRTKFQKLKQN